MVQHKTGKSLKFTILLGITLLVKTMTSLSLGISQARSAAMLLGAASPFSLSLATSNISKLLLISSAEQFIHLTQWLSAGVNLASPAPGNICQCLQTFLIVMTRNGGSTPIQWVEARGAATYPTMYRTASHSKELSSLKCQ